MSGTTTVETAEEEGGEAQRARNRRSIELRNQRRSQVHAATGFLVGATVEAERVVLMRAGEALDSPELTECAIGERMVILEHGAGRRLKVRRLPGGGSEERVGWVSGASATGERLLALAEAAPPPAEAPRAAAEDDVAPPAAPGPGPAEEEAHTALASLIQEHIPEKAPSVASSNHNKPRSVASSIKEVAAVGYTSRQAKKAASAAAEVAASAAHRIGTDSLPPGTEAIPGGCLCCMFVNLKRVKAP